MTDCVGFCGTGLNSGTRVPGDPDSLGALTVASAYGGVDVTWTMPAVNDHAVAYTIIYRGTSADPALMFERGRTGGTFYFDKDDSTAPVVWFYWIRHVSYNGTQLELIGPASASALPKIEEMLQLLTGKIDSGLLATSLKNSINQVEENRLNLIAENAQRVDYQGILTGTLTSLSIDLDGLSTAFVAEREERRTAYSSITESLDAMYVSYQDNSALITQEQIARAEGDAALSAQLTTLQAVAGGNTATLNTLTKTAVDEFETLVEMTNTLSAQNYAVTRMPTDPDRFVAPAEGDFWIQTPTEDAPDAPYLLFRWVNGDYPDGEWEPASSLYGAMASIQAESSARVSDTESLAESINSLTASTDESLATVTESVEALATTTGELGALYTVSLTTTVDADGEPQHLIGGFGLYNDGTTVKAGFDVDAFWVGRTDQNGIKPFIIDNGTVYINEATIKQVTLDKLRTATGGVVLENGKIKAELLEVDNATFSGQLDVKSSASGARMEIKNNVIKVFDAAGNIRVKIGDLSA